jgi:hypothetical protein
MPSGSQCDCSKIKIAQTPSRALVLLGAVGTDGRRTSPHGFSSTFQGKTVLWLQQQVFTSPATEPPRAALLLPQPLSSHPFRYCTSH